MLNYIYAIFDICHKKGKNNNIFIVNYIITNTFAYIPKLLGNK